MPAFIWSEIYMTGVPDVDKDHQKIFVLINELYDGYEAGQTIVELDSHIDELLAYVAYHFEREEGLLASIGYRDLENHAHAHQALSEQMKAYASLYRSSREAFDMDDFISFLGRWLQTHILVDDMAYLESVQQLVVRV